jgi:hypothetical protein
VNLWLRLRKIPYSSKAYSGCGGDECGEREGKDVVFPEVSTKIFAAAYHTQFDGHRWKSIDNDEHGTMVREAEAIERICPL